MSENRPETFSEKVRKFSVEGMLLRKISKKILTPVDRRLGIIVRHFVAKKTPVNPRKILFITFQNQYTCNPKYICEELIRQNVDCEIVWATSQKGVKNGGYGYPEGVTVVQNGSEEFYRELASAGIFIANSVEFEKRPMLKKKNQVFIETWHGSLGIKRFDKDANSGKGWVRAAKYTTKICDYLISNSDFEDEIYRNSFWPKQTIWKFGHPRNDILFDTGQRDTIRKAVCERYDIPEDARICLYAPTFRDSHTYMFYDIDHDKLIRELEKKFGGNWYVMLRFHPTVKKYDNPGAINNEDLKIKDATSYPDMQDLIVAADAGITDYSSWIYDFVLTGRPGFLYTVDLDDYYNERGFAYSLYDTPFPVCKNNDELMKAVEAFDPQAYEEKVKAFLEDKGCMEDGHASERTVDAIKKILKGAVTK